MHACLEEKRRGTHVTPLEFLQEDSFPLMRLFLLLNFGLKLVREILDGPFSRLSRYHTNMSSRQRRRHVRRTIDHLSLALMHKTPKPPRVPRVVLELRH